MRKICSWRLSRLTDVSAWKRLSFYKGWVFLIVFCIAFGAYWNFSDAEIMWTIFEIGIVLLLYVVLKTVLSADESYSIKLKTKRCHIYIYNKYGSNSNVKEIIFHEKDSEARVCTQETSLQEKGYRFCKWQDFSAFMYCVNGDNNEWFYLSPNSDSPQYLGKKLTYNVPDSVFLAGFTKEQKLDLRVLNDQSVMHICADSFVLGNAYVPPKSREEIRYEIDNEWYSADIPEDYLIVKNDGSYLVYGVSDTWVSSPKCQKISVRAIIFQEVRDRVVIAGVRGKYEELYRMLPATRWVNDVIAELKDEPCMGIVGGTVWKFNEDTLQMEKLYEGVYRALGFADGSIVGNDWQYTPELDEGCEYK